MNMSVTNKSATNTTFNKMQLIYVHSPVLKWNLDKKHIKANKWEWWYHIWQLAATAQYIHHLWIVCTDVQCLCSARIFQAVQRKNLFLVQNLKEFLVLPCSRGSSTFWLFSASRQVRKSSVDLWECQHITVNNRIFFCSLALLHLQHSTVP